MAREAGRQEEGPALKAPAFAYAKPASLEEAFDCLAKPNAKVLAGDESVAAAVSGAALYPGGAACHYCHGPSETQIAAAPSACTTCHSNLSPLLPDDHRVAWMRAHGSIASADPVACQNCHRDNFCINCHQNRDSITTFGHDRNYLSMHSVDARANPIQCGSCHREDFCSRCHAKAIK